MSLPPLLQAPQCSITCGYLTLSLGTLSDPGATALLGSSGMLRLEKLDIHHHYCSTEVVASLQSLGIEVDVSEPQQEDEDNGERYRYVAGGE